MIRRFGLRPVEGEWGVHEVVDAAKKNENKSKQ